MLADTFSSPSPVPTRVVSWKAWTVLMWLWGCGTRQCGNEASGTSVASRHPSLIHFSFHSRSRMKLFSIQFIFFFDIAFKRNAVVFWHLAVFYECCQQANKSQYLLSNKTKQAQGFIIMLTSEFKGVWHQIEKTFLFTGFHHLWAQNHFFFFGNCQSQNE